ncbi:MAG: 5'-nucleotidase C-terminal domain-containing protein [Lachnospiraceae bacterium]|nr:5'-nucleotidase C-terminal domain-containing protein [Lachnospiraceae bacterium]
MKELRKVSSSIVLMILLPLIILLVGCSSEKSTKSTTSENEANIEEKSLRIIATSDIHGKFYPYLYARNEEDTSGSMAQLATAIPKFYTNNTLLVDCGDSIQDNSANLFLDEEVHPVIKGLNRLGYDIWVTGNHEYNYGMDIVKKSIDSFDGQVLVGNVYDENGEPLADAYTILDRNGIRVAVIGMVTPYIQFWDSKNLAGYTVTDPVEETRKIIDKIQGQYDVLIGTMHMDIVNDNNYPHSGVQELAEECPEFDLIVAAHGHNRIEGELINKVVVVENKNMAQTMSVIDIDLDRSKDGWTVSDVRSQAIDISNYEPDAEFMTAFEQYNEKAVEDAHKLIGTFDGDYLIKENEIEVIPRALVEDSALIDLINSVMRFYSDADVTAAALTRLDANLSRGDIYKYNISNIYRYSNSLYKIKMTGSQLKTFMEWNASLYNQYQPGDLTISFKKDQRFYIFHMFSGINYDFDISQEEGNRITRLTWPDGTPVKNDDSFEMAIEDYCVNSLIMVPGVIFDEDDMPEIVDSEIRSDIGSIPDMIVDYIENECDGKLKAECDNNWKIVGNDWDEELHNKAVELENEGKLEVPFDSDRNKIAVDPIRESDLN